MSGVDVPLPPVSAPSCLPSAIPRSLSASHKRPHNQQPRKTSLVGVTTSATTSFVSPGTPSIGAADTMQPWIESAEAVAATVADDAPNLSAVVDGWPCLEGTACTEDTRPIFQAFVANFSSDGRTLYYYHAVQLIRHGLLTVKTPKATTARFKKAWLVLNDWYQGYWRHKTQGFHDRVVSGERFPREIMESGLRMNGFQVCTMSAKAFQALGIELEEVILPGGSRIRLLSATPSLDLFSDGLGSDHDPNELVTIFLHELKAAVERHRDLILKIRCKGVRINYDPTATDVTSIGSRLRLALRVGTMDWNSNSPISPVVASIRGGTKPVSHRFDTLLLPFVIMNATRFPQSEVYTSKVPVRETTTDYSSTWRHIEMHLHELRPINFEKREHVVSTVMDALRIKAQAASPPQGRKQKGPKYNLLTSYADAVASGLGSTSLRNLEGYGLHDNEHGFALALRTCFARPDLTGEEYEDMIEQKLFALGQHAITLFSTKAERAAKIKASEEQANLRKKQVEDGSKADKPSEAAGALCGQRGGNSVPVA